MKKYSAFLWIIKVINSCEKIGHYLTCKRLIKNYNKLFNDIKLTRILDRKADQILYELNNKD